jgi:predicted nucleic acid-binding Zn ribbon protein
MEYEFKCLQCGNTEVIEKAMKDDIEKPICCGVEMAQKFTSMLYIPKRHKAV